MVEAPRETTVRSEVFHSDTVWGNYRVITNKSCFL